MLYYIAKVENPILIGILPTEDHKIVKAICFLGDTVRKLSDAGK